MAVIGGVSVLGFVPTRRSRGQAFVVKIRALSGLIVLTEMGEEYENVADFVGYLGGGRWLHDSQPLQS